MSQIKDPANLALTLGYGANGLTSIQDPGTPVRTFYPDLTAGERDALSRAEAVWRHPTPEWSRVRDWRRLRLTPGTTAPDGSLTIPEILPPT